jgi:hypothetical protein
MLARPHGPGIYVHIRVDLDGRNFQPRSFQQEASRGGFTRQDIASVDDARAVFAGLCTDNALSDAADYAAADKDVLHVAKKKQRKG